MIYLEYFKLEFVGKLQATVNTNERWSNEGNIVHLSWVPVKQPILLNAQKKLSNIRKK